MGTRIIGGNGRCCSERAEELFDQICRRLDRRDIQEIIAVGRFEDFLIDFCGGEPPAVRYELMAQLQEYSYEEDSSDYIGCLLGGVREPRLPRWIGGFEIVSRLGSGGFCDVFKAYDKSHNLWVAIKTLRASNFSGSHLKNLRMRFVREAKIIKRLRHRGIVRVYGFGIDSRTRNPYLVQEYLGGEDLRCLIGKKDLTSSWALCCLRTIALALDYAHGKGVAHRDLKPDNVRILNAGQCGKGSFGSVPQVKLIDFGIAKFIDDAGLTRTGQAVGTVGYMAPEVLLGEPVDYRADIFSFGVVAYELLTRQRPFRGSMRDEIYYKVLHEDPAPILNQPQRVNDFIMRCLMKSPADRYGDLQGALEAIEVALDEVSEWRFDLGSAKEGVVSDGDNLAAAARYGASNATGWSKAKLFAESMAAWHKKRRCSRELVKLEEILSSPGQRIDFSVEELVETLETIGMGSHSVVRETRCVLEAQRIKGEGKALYSQGDYDDAASAFQEVLALDPCDFGTYVRLARALVKMGLHDMALEVRQKACQALPEDLRTYVSLSRALERHGRYSEAIEVRRRACKILPERFAAYVGLARLLERVGRQAEGIMVRRRACETLENDSRAVRSLARALKRAGMRRDSWAVRWKAWRERDAQTKNRSASFAS